MRLAATTTRRGLFRAGLTCLLARRSGAARGKQYFVYWGTYTAGGPQFGERLSPIAAVVRRDADRFADSSDATRSRAGGARVSQCGFGVVVEQFAGGDEMPGHDIGGRPIQSR